MGLAETAYEAKTVSGCLKDCAKKDKQAKFQKVKINCRDALGRFRFFG